MKVTPKVGDKGSFSLAGKFKKSVGNGTYAESCKFLECNQ